MINTINLPPFKKMCITIGNLPSSFMESMTYYEALCWLYKYFEETLLPAINTNSEAITELQTAFITLKEYVDNYFDNLDVQEEINNKLDAMAESGELEDIIEQILATSNSDIHFIRTHKTDNVSGNNTVITSEDGNVIIDFGYDTTGNDIANYLILNGITTLKYAIVTHYHGDHVGGANCEGLINLLDNAVIDWTGCTFILPPVPDSSEFIGDEITTIQNRYDIIVNKLTALNIPYITPTENQIITINDTISLKLMNIASDLWSEYYNITFVSNGSYEGDGTNYNNFSLVTEVTNKNIHVLLPSDIENKAQESIFNKLRGNYNIVAAEHHGANDTTYNKYLIKVKPLDFYIVPQNSLVNYNKQTNAFMRVSTIHTLGTATSGNICIKTDGFSCYAISENGEIDAPINMNDINLGINYTDVATSLANNNDLNNIIKPGTYRSVSSAMTNSLTNCPFTGSGCILKVEYNSNNNFIRQILIPNNRYDIYIRYYYQINSTTWGWSEWHEDFVNPYELNISIASNTDLNDITTPGAYYCGSGATAGTLTNAPITTTGFRLEVYRVSNSGSFRQVAYPNNSNNYYVRYKQGSTSAWQAWVTVTIS